VTLGKYLEMFALTLINIFLMLQSRKHSALWLAVFNEYVTANIFVQKRSNKIIPNLCELFFSQL